MCACLSDLILIILSVLFPPLPVWVRRGICTCDSLINILLCFLGYLPGLIHSWYIIAKYPPYLSRTDTNIYYVYRNDLENQTLQDHHHHHHHHTCDEPNRAQPAAQQAPRSYGAIDQQVPPAYSELDSQK